MEQPIPEWLNERFLSKCLQGEHQDEKLIKIISFHAIPAVAAGNNYGSNLLRVTLDYKDSSKEETISLSLIVKSPVANDARAEVFDSFKDVEPKFYYQFLPQASKLANDSFAPKSYFSALPLVVVLEDLKVLGYTMADRVTQLDFDHCRLYAVTSARFHAVSIAVHKVNPQLVEDIGKEKLFLHGIPMFDLHKMMFQDGCETVSNFMEQSELKSYASLIRRASNVLMDKVVEAHQPSKILNCLNQGDPWTTNMMFKYNESGKVDKIKLLDFQVLRYGSPVNDLVFFLWCSANNDVRENKTDELFRTYHSALNSKLKDLNCAEYLSYEDLLKNVELLSPLMLMIVVAYLPIMMNPGVVMDIDELFTRAQNKTAREERSDPKWFTEDYCKKHLMRHLKQLEKMGVFKYLDKLFG